MPNKKTICFRVDASVEMGIGHVMRCLTLADALTADGVECHFICREHSGSLSDTIKAKGHHIYSLPMASDSNSGNIDEQLPVHASWVGSDWRTDAQQTRDYIEKLKPEWLVVDHYGLDFRWEQRLRSTCTNLMVIDDLADRNHECNLLLDQTFGRQPSLYEARVPRDCEILTGADFMLLRPEFSRDRNYSLQSKQTGKLKKILINLGGADKDNLTGKVLDSFKSMSLAPDTKIIVVVGGAFPWAEQVALTAKTLAYHVDIFSNVTNMAELMSECDLAIGAAGSTSWERCCMGLPSVILVSADNQVEVAKSLEQCNAVIRLQDIDCYSLQLEEIILKLQNERSDLLSMSLSARKVTDGSGVENVKRAMFPIPMINNQGVSLRQATKSDCDLVFEWQTQPGMRKHFGDPKTPAYKDHCRWFLNSLDNKYRDLFIVMHSGRSAGVLRLDQYVEKDVVFEVSILLDEKYQRLGIAGRALGLLRREWPDRTLVAFVKEENTPSKILFESSGYTFDGKRYVSRP